MYIFYMCIYIYILYIITCRFVSSPQPPATNTLSLYWHRQEIEGQQAVFPAAQWSKKILSACAMDDYVKVLYFTRVEKWFLTYVSCISLPRPMVILVNLVLPMAHAQRFYCVLHALRGCRTTKLIPWECPHSMFYCVLHALRGWRATKLGPWECPHSIVLHDSRTHGMQMHVPVSYNRRILWSWKVLIMTWMLHF